MCTQLTYLFLSAYTWTELLENVLMNNENEK